jgi:asparagine synthase (glutamine-hydrolysing)
MLPGMVMHTERSRMSWNPTRLPAHALEVEYPAAVEPPMPRELKPGGDPPGAIWEIVTSSLRRWLEGYAGGVAVEVSGGLDSALVAAAATSVSQTPVRSCGIALAGPSRRDERERRRIVAELFGLEDREVDILDWLPFAPSSCRLGGGAVVPWEECYYEAADAMLEAAVGNGATLVLTGLGGDELCGRRPGERAAPPSGNGVQTSPWLDVPAFLSPIVREAYEDTRALEGAPQPLAAISVPECIAIGSAMYMRRGTWAVHPLATPELIRFCAQLPREWRRGRVVQRALLERLRCPRQLTHPATTDDFMPALAAAFRHAARPVISRLFGESRLADLGLVERDRLVADYAAWCAEGEDVDGAMPFYSAAVLELTVRALES